MVLSNSTNVAGGGETEGFSIAAVIGIIVGSVALFILVFCIPIVTLAVVIIVVVVGVTRRKNSRARGEEQRGTGVVTVGYKNQPPPPPAEQGVRKATNGMGEQPYLELQAVEDTRTGELDSDP